MTFKQKLTSMLTEHGLWPKEAEEVMDSFSKSDSSMKGRWDDDVKEYSLQLLSAVWLGVKQAAIDHLKATKPEHFAISVLESP